MGANCSIAAPSSIALGRARRRSFHAVVAAARAAAAAAALGTAEGPWGTRGPSPAQQQSAPREKRARFATTPASPANGLHAAQA
jgi:hypothetical protein